MGMTRFKRVLHSVFMYGLLASVILGLASLHGCGRGELNRSHAERILNKVGADHLETRCRLQSVLAAKPEFSKLRNKPLCEGKWVVTGIVNTGDGLALVDAKPMWRYDPRVANEWMSAFAKLETRLLQLEGERYFLGVRYKDPVDGQEFNVAKDSFFPEKDMSISAAGQWLTLMRLRADYEDLLKYQSVAGRSTQFRFARYDDGWRVVSGGSK